MQTFHDGYRGFGLLVMLNWDRLLFVAMLAVALSSAAWIATL